MLSLNQTGILGEESYYCNPTFCEVSNLIIMILYIMVTEYGRSGTLLENLSLITSKEVSYSFTETNIYMT